MFNEVVEAFLEQIWNVNKSRFFEHKNEKQVRSLYFRQYCASCCLMMKSRAGRSCRCTDFWGPEAQRQACDLWASWGWSKYSGTPFRWTILHGNGLERNTIWRGEKKSKERNWVFSVSSWKTWKHNNSCDCQHLKSWGGNVFEENIFFWKLKSLKNWLQK